MDENLSYYRSNEKKIIRIQSTFRGFAARKKIRNDENDVAYQSAKPQYFNESKEKEPALIG